VGSGRTGRGVGQRRKGRLRRRHGGSRLAAHSITPAVGERVALSDRRPGARHRAALEASINSEGRWWEGFAVHREEMHAVRRRVDTLVREGGQRAGHAIYFFGRLEQQLADLERHPPSL
jgi:hypothetical protein